MIGCLRTRIRKQPIIALYFESENELKIISRPDNVGMRTLSNWFEFVLRVCVYYKLFTRF